MSGLSMTLPNESERLRRQRAKNWAVAGVILGVVVLIYVTFMIRATGGS